MDTYPLRAYRPRGGVIAKLCAVVLAACSTSQPLAPAPPAPAVLSIGATSGCVVLKDGAVGCWGLNQYGQLGLNPSGFDKDLHAPSLVPGVGNAIAVGTKGPFSCALLASGAVQCWGVNGSGQLGNETLAPAYAPTLVHGPAAGQNLQGAKALSVGYKHSCAVAGDGSLYCWGVNDSGQLGLGAGGDRSIATVVPPPSPALRYVDVGVGRDHTCALASDGTVWCAGSNEQNQLGSGPGDPSASMVQVPSVSNVQRISAGDAHTCIVGKGGTVQCWGRGLSKETSSQTISNFTAVATGNGLTCALTADGHVACWGDNSRQQIGAGSLGPSVGTAYTIPGVNGAVALSTGLATTCVITASGQVQCWGANFAGEAGNGSQGPIASSAPFTLTLPGAGSATVAAPRSVRKL